MDEATEVYQVIIATEGGDVHECEISAPDAVAAAVICRANYAPTCHVINAHARRIGTG